MTDGLGADLVADLRSLLGGERSYGAALIAPVVFAIVNRVAGLGWGSAAAITAGAAVVAARVVRGRSRGAALYGLGGVAVAIALALRSGRSQDYFLPSIVSTAALAVVTLGTMTARRPMAAWVSWFLRRWPLDWYWRDDVRPAYSEASAIWLAYYATRVAISWLLYDRAATGWLAVSRVVLSWPTMLPLLAVTYWYGNRRLHRLGGPTVDEHRSGHTSPPYGHQRGF